ncbi:MAG: efflux RND transporter periplasmic adaptor subunit [Rhodobacteraceae bacterium]|jgi:HlyD family secretion protein|nr:efflux RND transporter periplasmic adaptor subunit [Paracoccaceae bacterium]
MPELDVATVVGLAGGRKRRWRGWAAVLLILAGIGGTMYWRASEDKVPPYLTASVTRSTVIESVTATGTVEPTNLVEISSELSGTLASVEVDFNDTVEVGQTLARLDTGKLMAQVAVYQASLDAAIARVAMAQASLTEAREVYEAGQELDRRGVQSHQTSVAQRAAYVRAEASLQSAIADRSLAEANLDLQQADLEMACICSPIRGVVLDRSADVGQIVAAALSAPVLFTIAEDLREMELRVDIDEADIGRVAVGAAASFTVEAYDDLEFPAAIAEIRFAPQTIAGVVTYKAVLSVDNSEMLLRPGMTATADIRVAAAQDVLTVPNAALRYAPPVGDAGEMFDGPPSGGPANPFGGRGETGGDAGTVWVLRDGEAREIPVETGLTDGRFTQILAGDLAEGDLVITDLADD